MSKYVIVAAGVLGIIDAFIKSTALNAIVFIIVGIAAVYFGFKLFPKSKIGGVISALVGIEFFIFGFIKPLTTYGTAHVAISIILGLILLVAPFLSAFVKE